jgi:hypothetical protein
MQPLSLVTNHHLPHHASPSANTTLSSPTESEAEMDTGLKREILGALVQSAVDDQKFLPIDKLEQLTTRLTVEAELKVAGIENESLTRFVLEKAGRLFLTLVHTESVEALLQLWKDGFNDQHLPIGIRVPKKMKRKFHYVVGSLAEPGSELKPQRWSAFDNWQNKDLELFEAHQWLFLTPIFTKSTFQYRFHGKRPLPFTSKNLYSEKSGFFSTVYQVVIHDAHQQVFVGDQNSISTRVP